MDALLGAAAPPPLPPKNCPLAPAPKAGWDGVVEGALMVCGAGVGWDGADEG